MNFKPVVIFLGVVLSGFFLVDYSHISVAIAREVNQNHTEIEMDILLEQDVIFLGENHDNPQHHARQLEIITQLHQNADDTQLAIGMEMFQRPFQPILDLYLAGEIGEQQLREQTEYDSRWGFDWELYAPILRYAQQEQIAVIALNTPEEITHKVAENGINSLEQKDFRYIPPLNQIKLDNGEYRQRLGEIYLQHVKDGQGNSQNLDNFFAAQVLWDETMAEAIAFYYQNNPQSQIVVLVGRAHVMYDYAIPDRVDRRIKDESFQDIVYLL